MRLCFHVSLCVCSITQKLLDWFPWNVVSGWDVRRRRSWWCGSGPESGSRKGFKHVVREWFMDLDEGKRGFIRRLSGLGGGLSSLRDSWSNVNPLVYNPHCWAHELQSFVINHFLAEFLWIMWWNQSFLQTPGNQSRWMLLLSHTSLHRVPATGTSSPTEQASCDLDLHTRLQPTLVFTNWTWTSLSTLVSLIQRVRLCSCCNWHVLTGPRGFLTPGALVWQHLALPALSPPPPSPSSLRGASWLTFWRTGLCLLHVPRSWLERSCGSELRDGGLVNTH